MWTRFLNVFSTGWSAFQFTANPMQFAISLIMIMLAPYLVYLFWGSVIFSVAVLIFVGWLVYRFFTKRRSRI